MSMLRPLHESVNVYMIQKNNTEKQCLYRKTIYLNVSKFLKMTVGYVR